MSGFKNGAKVGQKRMTRIWFENLYNDYAKLDI